MSGPLSFEWDKPEAVAAQLRSLLAEQGGKIRRVPRRAIERGCFELLRILQVKAPKKTSTLVRSLHVAIEQMSADLIEGRVGTWLEYARYLVEGTGVYGPKKRPITILPKAKQGLFWGAYSSAGKPIVRRRVVIQGMKPKWDFDGALAEFLPRYMQILEEELAKETAA